MIRGSSIEERIASLTVREVKVLMELADGKLYKEIASDMSIAPQSVQRFLTRAKRKLGARTGTHAIVLFDRSRKYYVAQQVGSPLPRTGRLR